MERMKWIEDLDVRGICTQGIVLDGGFIRTCIASCRVADHRLAVIAGFPVGRTFSYPSGSCRLYSAGSFWSPSRKHLMPVNFSSSTLWNRCRRGLRSPGIWQT
jgi:hypothetical protein